MWSKFLNLSIFPTILNKDGNVNRARVVDPYANQEFIINRFGWITSDISLLLSADEKNLQDNLLSRLQVLKSESPNLSEREMLDTLCMRYCQSFAERERFMQTVREQYPDWFKDNVEGQHKLVEKEEDDQKRDPNDNE